jgi:hypothetical protein
VNRARRSPLVPFSAEDGDVPYLLWRTVPIDDDGSTIGEGRRGLATVADPGVKEFLRSEPSFRRVCGYEGRKAERHLRIIRTSDVSYLPVRLVPTRIVAPIQPDGTQCPAVYREERDKTMLR